jgi:hypothetical protein
MNLIKKLDNLKVFTTSAPERLMIHEISCEKYIRTAGLEELMRVNDSGKKIKYW